MEIKFNPSSIPDPGTSQPVTRRDVPSPVETNVSTENVESLKNAINNIPLVRPEKVERARSLVADVEYPPNEVLQSISNLLAMNIK